MLYLKKKKKTVHFAQLCVLLSSGHLNGNGEKAKVAIVSRNDMSKVQHGNCRVGLCYHLKGVVGGL